MKRSLYWRLVLSGLAAVAGLVVCRPVAAATQDGTEVEAQAHKTLTRRRAATLMTLAQTL